MKTHRHQTVKPTHTFTAEWLFHFWYFSCCCFCCCCSFYFTGSKNRSCASCSVFVFTTVSLRAFCFVFFCFHFLDRYPLTGYCYYPYSSECNESNTGNIIPKLTRLAVQLECTNLQATLCQCPIGLCVVSFFFFFAVKTKTTSTVNKQKNSFAE